MTDTLATVTITLGLLAAAWSLVTALRDRPMGRSHLAALAVVEAALLVQAVVAFSRMAGGHGPRETATFIGYAIGILLLPPAAAAWGVMERSRWGPAVIVVAGLSVAIMTVRMQQIWQGVDV